MNKFFEFLGGRKMFFALILTIVVSVFLFTDKCELAFCVNIKLATLFGLECGLKIQMYEIDRFINYIISYE